jgi:DNA-binding transcriptional regulator YdaS (Cro superfamily)
VGRVLAVEAVTGVSRHDLRPDIYGEATAPPPLMAVAS